LVLLAGAELFTGNMLMIVAFLDKKIKLRALLRNWGIVYVGNFIGALVFAVAIAASKHYTFGQGAVADNIFGIANAKLSYDFLSALLLGIFCNFCVCLATWMAYSARSTGGKIASMFLPIIALVAGGFEHSIANMYFIPVAFFIRLFNPRFVASLGNVDNLTLPRFFFNNLIPVSIGNMLGGAFFVGTVYWFAYLRKSK
jgi:formate/nitrite transporter